MDNTREEKYKATLRAARDKINELTHDATELRRRLASPGSSIAIIGMAGEFPGDGDSCESFRRMLLDGIDTTGDIPASRWDNERYYSKDPGAPGKYYCPRGSFLKRDPFAFDNDFFGISPAEAEAMDPHQRILLNQSWHALENAGIAPSTLRGSDTGFFVGFSSYDYLMSFATPDLDQRGDPYTLTGSAFNSAAGRLSYYYDVHGPSVTMDTACSSSLVAVMNAVESLRKGVCPIALAGGVNLLLSPLSYVALCAIRGLSADGLSRAFGEGATGFGRGEGCGFLVLKRLEDAVADGDRIHAVILGGAVGHDGKSGGFTAPSGIAQRRIIERAIQDAGVVPDDLTYVETHGTGTELGDPIEAGALSEVFSARKRKLLIGSVKSNIGHLEAAAGIAAIFKTVYAVRDGEIAPSLHADVLSTHIDWDRIPIEVCRRRTPWPDTTGRRIAGVSSFGISGTGAHIVIAGPPNKTNNAESLPERPLYPEWRVLPISAKSDSSLRVIESEYAEMLAGENVDFNEICTMAGQGRDHFRNRLAVCAADISGAESALRDYSGGKRNRAVVTGTGKNRVRTVFLYSGQGSQAAGMGRELYRTHPVFKDTLDTCARMAETRLKKPLIEVMFGDDSETLNRTLYTQPVIYAMEAALTDLWRSFGIRPSAVVGHSIGEYAAAYAAGVFPLEEGMEIVLERARLAESIEEDGTMAAVLTDEETAKNYLADSNVDIAAVNGSDSIVISGASSDVAGILAAMREKGIEHREMPVSHAFHSPLIEPVLDKYRRFLRGQSFRKPAVRFISAMNSAVLDGSVDWPDYWAQQMRRTVRFAEALAVTSDADVFLEIGASPTLTSLCRTLTDGPVWLFSQGPGIPAWKQISLSLARLYVSGCAVDFGGGVFKRGAGTDVPLYPFNETNRKMKPTGNVSQNTMFEMPSVEMLNNATTHTAARIMRMQTASMQRLFDRQIETLRKLKPREFDTDE